MKQFSTYNRAFAEDSAGAAWLYRPSVQRLLSILSEGGEGARVIGGAARDTLLGRPVGDIDIAVTLTPDKILERVKQAGFGAVPVGIEFGTVRVLAKGQSFEVTALREDVVTDGRHAEVRFCRDWALDAQRRDFTVNALSVDKEGRLYDYTGGLRDIESGTLRFIGEPEARIREDYLRILRFFRFYASFGRGRPDAAALKAIAKLKDGLLRLSAERVWAELKKLLAAPDPFRSLLWMRAGGALPLILPESGKWGLDLLKGMMDNERAAAAVSAETDALLRLETLIPPREERVKPAAARLKLSAKERHRLLNWARMGEIDPHLSGAELKRLIYHACRKSRNNGAAEGGAGRERARPQALLDRLQTAYAAARVYDKAEECQLYADMLKLAETWIPPIFPVSAADMQARGLQGSALGKALKQLERAWADADFSLSREELLRDL